MRLKFIGAPHLTEYHGSGLDLRLGESREIPDDRARTLLNDFPGIFVADVPAPTMDRQIKEPPRRKRG